MACRISDCACEFLLAEFRSARAGIPGSPASLPPHSDDECIRRSTRKDCWNPHVSRRTRPRATETGCRPHSETASAFPAPLRFRQICGLPPRQPCLPDTASPAPPLDADKVAAQQIQVPLQTPASGLEYSCSRRKPVALRPNNSAFQLARRIARSPEKFAQSSARHLEQSIGSPATFHETATPDAACSPSSTLLQPQSPLRPCRQARHTSEQRRPPPGRQSRICVSPRHQFAGYMTCLQTQQLPPS